MSVTARVMRRAAASLLLVTGFVGLAATPATASVRPLTFVPATPMAGEYTAVTGAVPATTSRPVRLQRWSGAWSTVASTTSTRTGDYRFRIRAVRGSWRVVAPSSTGGASYVGPTRSLTIAGQLLRFSAPASATAGGSVAMVATAVPVRPGRPVQLQRYVDGSWQAVAGTQERSDGRAALTTVVTAGTWKVRAFAPGYQGARAVASQFRTVTVTAPTFPDATGPVVRLTDNEPWVAADVTFSAGPGANVMSADGRWIVFASRTANLVAGDDNDAEDTFLYDRTTGAITLIGRDPDGSVPAQGSSRPTISADGRWITFSGPGSLLGEPEDNARTVYLWDRVEDLLQRVAPTPSSQGSISADGGFITYVGTSDDGVGSSQNVYLWSRTTGATTLVTADAAGLPLRYRSADTPFVANGGAFVVFGGTDAGHNSHLWRWRASDRSTVLIDHRASDGTAVAAQSYFAAMSADGRKVAYASSSDELVAGDGPASDGSSTDDVFLWDGLTGTNRLISRALDPDISSTVRAVRISADGRYVVHSVAAQPGQELPLAIERIDTTTLARTRLAANPGTDPAATWDGAVGVSPDGRYVVLPSRVAHVVGDTNSTVDLHVGDLEWGVAPAAGAGFAPGRQVPAVPWTQPAPAPLAASLVSHRADGTAAGGSSPALSGDGRYVAFTSDAPDLDLADANDPTWPPNTFGDVFVRDTVTGGVDRITDGLDGSGANLSAYSPSISRDGTWVLYESPASNLAPGDRSGDVNYDLFLTNRVTGATTMVTRAGAWDTEHFRHTPLRGGALSPNGRYVAYWADFTLDQNDPLPQGLSRLHLYDRTTGTTVRMRRTPDYLGRTDVEGFGSWPVSVSDDGTVAFARRAGAIEADVPFDTNDTPLKVYLWAGGGPTAAPRAIATESPAGATAVRGGAPDISADGSTVVFTSAVPAAGDLNGVPDVLRYVVATGATTVVSATGGVLGDDVSFAPEVSDDGSVVTFLSLASNLDGVDENLYVDGYAWRAGLVQRLELRDGVSPNRGADQVAVAGGGGFAALGTEAWAGSPDANGEVLRDVYRVTLG